MNQRISLSPNDSQESKRFETYRRSPANNGRMSTRYCEQVSA